MHNKDYITSTEAYDLFPSLPKGILQRWRWADTGPNYIRVGKCILYQVRDIEEFLLSRLVVPSNAGKTK